MSFNKTPQFILDSNRQCAIFGMDPREIRTPRVNMTMEELESKRSDYSEILEVVSFFSHKLVRSLKGTPVLLVISDEKGFILEMVGDETIKATVNQLGIQAGAQFTQEDMGTNVISLTLQQKHPVQVIGQHHYHEFLHGTACYGVPFHYTDIDNLLGSLSIMTTVEQQNPLFLVMLSNVVDSIERELLLRKQNSKLNIMNQVMLSRTRNAIIITDAEGRVTEFNAFAERISGFKRRDIIGRDIFKSDITGAYFKEVLRSEKKYKDVEMKFENNNGERIICLFDAQPIYDNRNLKIIGAFAQLRNITERYLMEEKYNYLAFHDELTDLPNRRFFYQKLDQLLNAEKKTKHIALMIIDLDRFKIINDTFGHSSGDKVLMEVTDRLKKCLRPGDTIARISGDEFMFLLQDIKEEHEVTEIAEQVLLQFKKPFTINNNEFHTTASMGIAVYQNDGTTLEEFMVQVDAAMYKAKFLGKNGYVVFTNDMYTDSSKELYLELDLRKAVEKKEFVLYYQPQVNIKTGEIIGLEALIRWKHPTVGIIHPNKFIPLAEKTGLIIPIGEWVLEEACRQNKEWQEKGLLSVKVDVNLSTHQFLKQNLVEVIKTVLKKTKLESRFLELEITESMAMDFNYAIRILKQIGDLGVRISMDDFGTGYSSLSYLKRFAIHCLKIDKSFVNDVLQDENDAKIVGTIIAMAHGLGLRVIAEGVEELGQLQFLHDQQCDEVQGFYFTEPLSARELEENFENIAAEIKRKSYGRV